MLLGLWFSYSCILAVVVPRESDRRLLLWTSGGCNVLVLMGSPERMSFESPPFSMPDPPRGGACSPCRSPSKTNGVKQRQWAQTIQCGSMAKIERCHSALGRQLIGIVSIIVRPYFIIAYALCSHLTQQSIADRLQAPVRVEINHYYSSSSSIL